MNWLKIPNRVFFVRSMEQHVSPCCGEELKVIGSRRRKYVNSANESIVLIIRRLCCQKCGSVHHELPNNLVPYKRYDRESIEAALTCDRPLAVGADESTLYRWRRWFHEQAPYWVGCLTSLAARFRNSSAEEESGFPQSILERIWHFVGNGHGWLERIVRPVANANYWVHTRFAFLS